MLQRIDARYAEWSNKQSLAEWNYASNLTDENLAAKLNVSAEAANIMKQTAQEVNSFPWQELQDENIKRQFQKLSILGTAALPADVSTRMNRFHSQAPRREKSKALINYKNF